MLSLSQLLQQQSRLFYVLKALAISPLIARKSDNYHYRDSWESNNRERKQRAETKKNKKLRAMTLEGAIEKRLILLSQYWKIIN